MPELKQVFVDPTRLRLWMRRAGRHAGRITTFAQFQPAGVPSVAINGPMFGDSGEIEARLLDRASGIDEPGSRPDDGMTFSVVDGRMEFRHGAEAAPGATFAVQLRPVLVANGVATSVFPHSSAMDDVMSRTALMVTRDARLAFVEGEATMAGLAADLVGLGAFQAAYLDGGREALLYANGRRYGPGSAGSAAWLYVPGTHAFAAPRSSSSGLGLVVLLGAVWMLTR